MRLSPLQRLALRMFPGIRHEVEAQDQRIESREAIRRRSIDLRIHVEEVTAAYRKTGRRFTRHGA